MTPEIISQLGIALSIVAIIISIIAIKYSKQQADAATGNVRPTFSAYQLPDDGESYRNRFAVEIINYNRKALQVSAVHLQLPASVIAYHSGENTRELLTALHGVLIKGRTSLMPTVPFRLKGLSNGECPEPYLIVFSVQFIPSDRELSFRVGAAIEFKLDGERHTTTAYASTLFEPITA